MAVAQFSTPTVADAIELTLEWLDRQGCSEPDKERRTTGRSRYRVNARISYAAPGSSVRTQMCEVTTRNLSRTGLSFVHKNLIYPRQIVDIQLPLPDRSVRHMKGRVVRVRPSHVGLYEIAVEFTEIAVTLV